MMLGGTPSEARTWLVERFCDDPNPHHVHAWPAYTDEEPRYWCRGVQDVPLTARDLL